MDDEARFRQLFQTTYRELVAYARRRTVGWAEADDVVSETYAVAWRRRADMDPVAPPLPWLYGIAANVLRNHRRGAGRRLQLVDRLKQEPIGAAAVDHAGAEIRDALDQLSDDDQEVLRLVAWEGLSHAEVGEVLGVSTNAVGIRIHRARQRLHAQLTAPEEGTS